MQAILDAPIGTDFLKELERSDFFPPQTGKAILGLFSNFTSAVGYGTALQLKDLLQERPIQEVLQLTADGEGAGFYPTVTFVCHMSRLEILRWKT